MEYQKKIRSDRYDVVIIGSGMAGLTCSARLVSGFP